MQATLHLPGAAPRPLATDELIALAIREGVRNHLILGVSPEAPALRALLGTDIPAEVLASGSGYLVVSVENAADYGFGPTPSAEATFASLTGWETDEDEPLVGPLLIIEA